MLAATEIRGKFEKVRSDDHSNHVCKACGCNLPHPTVIVADAGQAFEALPVKVLVTALDVLIQWTIQLYGDVKVFVVRQAKVHVGFGGSLGFCFVSHAKSNFSQVFMSPVSGGTSTPIGTVIQLPTWHTRQVFQPFTRGGGELGSGHLSHLHDHGLAVFKGWMGYTLTLIKTMIFLIGQLRERMITLVL